MLKTWDIFDTLIARRCIEPRLVFHIMEQRLKLSGFTQARIAASQNIAKTLNNYSLDDIYSEFGRITNLDQNTCNNLKNIEYQTEIEQAIPITENILQVKSGDILITDMYLPESIIRKMLLKCGLTVPVEIVITSNGKSSGRVWKQIAAQNPFVFHIGDNEISDIKNPRDVGFDSALTIWSRPNFVENYLLQKDFEFGAYLREIRLRNPYQDEIKRKYWEFFTLNIGILIILVQLIDELQKKCGFEYLGFCGRDAYYLWLIYQKFKEDKHEISTPNDYLYYSRKIMHTSEKEMAQYFSSKINNRKALMIDLAGTGVHLYNLKLNFGLKYSMLMCNFLPQGKKAYPGAVIPENWINFFQISNATLNEDSNFYFYIGHTIAVELFNRATHNSPIKLNLLEIENKIVPDVIFNETNDTENLDVFLTCVQEVLKTPIKPLIYGGGVEEILNQLAKIFANLTYPLTGIFYSRHEINSKVDDLTILKNYRNA